MYFASQPIDATWLPALAGAAHSSMVGGSHSFPEAENPMLEHILHSIDQRLGSIDKRLDRMDARFDKMDERFDKMDERFREVDQRFCVLTADVAGLNTAVNGLSTRIARVESAQDNFTALVRDFGASLARTQTFIEGPTGFAALGTRTEELLNQLSVLSYRMQIMPSWKFLGVAAAGTVASAAGSVTWLMQGGAKTLSRWFE